MYVILTEIIVFPFCCLEAQRLKRTRPQLVGASKVARKCDDRDM